METETRTCTRPEAIAELRHAIEGLQDEEHSICRIAAERNLFCRGFAQWSLGDLRKRYPQVVRGRPRISRARLEEMADRWQLMRQQLTGQPTACDVQMHERSHQQCRGWDEFTDADLERFHGELCGEAIAIVPERS